MGMDGRVYEKSAIKQAYDTSRQPNGKVKSPFTNELIADTLVPAPQTKNTIQSLIDEKLITGSRCWL